jgi:serine/threonine protein kinase
MAIHREIYILAGLDHPNMMKLFEVIDTRTHVNLVTEFCHGCNLFEYVRAFGRKCKVGKNKVTSFRLDEPAAKKVFK